MKKSRIIRMLSEVIEDKQTGKQFWFDLDLYKHERDWPKPLSTKDICTKMELNTTYEFRSEEALMKRIKRFNNYVDDCKSGVMGDISFIKSLGLALAGDEMKFLIPISIESFEQIVNSLKIQTNIEGTNEIYNQLNKVLYLLEISCYFNYIPSTKEDGEGYFNKLMMEIRQDVDKTFVNKPIIRKRLYELVDEVDFIINSCEVPGVPDNWLKLNPNIKYFDSVFDIIEENPELYKSIKNEHLRGNPIQFNFFPSKQEIAERQKYFEEKRQKYPTRTIDRFYQDELVETLNKRFNQCLEKIAKHKLDMKLVEAEYTFDNNKLLFYFTADGRIDFRELVKDLAAVFRTRIELRQIGVRDETKIMGGIGICGRELCCHSYLSEFVPVSIKMAKEQNLSLNPTKISGVCGRLMCCLKNEEETYEYLNSRLPNVGDYVTTDDGLKGEVSSVSVLRQMVKVLVEVDDEKEIRDYSVDQLKFKSKRRRDHVKLTAQELKELSALEDKGGKSKIDDAK